MSPRKSIQFIGLLTCLNLIGCSEASNVNGLIAGSWSRQDPAALLSRSEILLDQGDYAGALDNAEAALKLAPDCGSCAVQLSYSHLGVAGLDLFQLARKMLDKGSTEPASASLAEASNAAGQLSSLASLVGLSETDYEAITLPGNRLGDLEGAPASGAFRELPVLLPKSAPDARVSESITLHHIDQAIMILCPFVTDSVKLLGDTGDIRHTDESCSSRGEQDAKKTKALFIWAMAHLVEAVAFHQVVMFEPDGVTPNLQKRSAVLEDRSVITSLTEYVKAVTDLAGVVDIILPTDSSASKSSMLTAMFNDLETVSLAFQNMTAVPAELAKGIIDAISDLRGQKDKINKQGKKQDSDDRAVAFKDQLTAGLATELKRQIDTKFTSGELSDSEKTDLCAAYRQISTEAFASCDAL